MACSIFFVSLKYHAIKATVDTRPISIIMAVIELTKFSLTSNTLIIGLMTSPDMAIMPRRVTATPFKTFPKNLLLLM